MWGFQEIVVLVVCLMALVRCQSGTELVCSSEPSTGMLVAVGARRKARGNWVTTVDMERGGDKDLAHGPITKPWTVAVLSNTRTCEGTDTILHVTLTITEPPNKPRSDYEPLAGGGYYKFHTEAVTWARARQICAEEESHLLIVNSESEATAMKALFTKFKSKITKAGRTDFVWVGVYEQGTHGNYLTTFGKPLSTTGFVRWSPGDPNLTGANDCIVLYESNTGLVDVACTDLYAFICETTDP